MKIRALVDADKGPETYYWRINSPFKYLRMYGHDVQTINHLNKVDKDTNILILPKVYCREENKPEVVYWLTLIKANGTKVVYDADDDMWSESFVSYMIKLMYSADKGINLLHKLIDQLEERRKNHLWILGYCDAITVSTEPLREYVSTITDTPVYLVRNAIDITAFRKGLKPRIIDDFVTIGWAGGSRPIADIENMLLAWDIIAATRPEAKFQIAGWCPDLESFNIFPERLTKIAWQPIEQYSSGMQVDIGCVSVGSDPFSQRKSLNKAWEFSQAEAMVIGSTSLYGTEPIVYCESVNDWVQTLNYFISHRHDIRSAQTLYTNYVQLNYDMKYNWMHWLSTYERIINAVDSGGC